MFVFLFLWKKKRELNDKRVKKVVMDSLIGANQFMPFLLAITDCTICRKELASSSSVKHGATTI